MHVTEKGPKEYQVERFFAFVVKREQLRLRKESGAPWPWSDDEILNTYKFTNVKREHDRTTRWMRKNWTGPNASRPCGEIIYNCALFRYFGTTEFAAAVRWQHKHDPDNLIAVAERQRSIGERVFTGAYIIPTLGKRNPKHIVVSREILGPLWDARNKLARVATTTNSWRLSAEALRQLPGFGGTGFMAKEVLQDLMQTQVLGEAVDRNTWCPAGPGARRGLNRLCERPLAQNIRDAQLLEEMLLIFCTAKYRLPPFMPNIELHDIQFQLCEFDKYERARLGEGRPKSRYRVRLLGRLN